MSTLRLLLIMIVGGGGGKLAAGWIEQISIFIGICLTIKKKSELDQDN